MDTKGGKTLGSVLLFLNNVGTSNPLATAAAAYSLTLESGGSIVSVNSSISNARFEINQGTLSQEGGFLTATNGPTFLATVNLTNVEAEIGWVNILLLRPATH